jgi:hypothetical protein
MSNKPELMPALPTFGWIIDAGIEPWIDVWAIHVLSQRIREKRPRMMREAHRIQYRYKERLWSFLIPEEHLRDKADGKTYDTGLSQVCLSSNELRNKFEEIRLSHLAKMRTAADRLSYELAFHANELQKIGETVRRVAKELESLGSLAFPIRELHAGLP